ncbi:uncharacterized protein N7498_000420 [Penicillium cinerascens]|uniref:Uncharacterized protein n=1 Tax=Penicillium cinerascens TaxID=70096 RepID=A0A9W9NEB7_9EURO|nr:uncharacterized protein N7498_000420 [Penicillium cinerascens]KAJ5218321.1 hypothetical protein N7498_000420 [Penicillium cinerascens]
MVTDPEVMPASSPTAGHSDIFDNSPREAAIRDRRRREYAASDPLQVSAPSVTKEPSPRSVHTPSTFDVFQASTPTPEPRRGSVSMMTPEQRSPTTQDTIRLAPVRSRKRARTNDRSDEEAPARRRSGRLTQDRDSR